MHIRFTFARALSAALLLFAVGAVSTASPAQAQSRPAGPHTMPLRTPDGQHAYGSPSALSAPAGAHLTYNGGPVISNVSVHSVYWGNGTYQAGAGPADSQITNFFSGVTNSAYMDWLLEYNTPTQSIGRGSFDGKTTITPSATNDGTSIDSQNIANELLGQLNAGTLPAPKTDAGGNVNTLYAFFFPEGKTLTDGTDVGGQQFCAYHSTISFNSLIVPFAVLPDFADAQAGYSNGCGTSSDLFENFTSTVAHELIESVTDPGVGLATGDGAPLGWYDNGKGAISSESQGGEIADLCEAQGPVKGGDGVTYTVQSVFSNGADDCIVTPAAGYATACADAPAGAFSDAGQAADCLKTYDISLGKQDGTFGEEDPLLRSQVSSLLARLLQQAGSPLTQTHAFPDVNANTVPNDQVRAEIGQLAGSGIIAGFPDGTFGPATNLTVAQAATLVVRTLHFIHSTHPASPDITDVGSTTANYTNAIVKGILDTVAANVAGEPYARQPGDTTKRGLLADMLAQSIQKLVTAGVVASH